VTTGKPPSRPGRKSRKAKGPNQPEAKPDTAIDKEGDAGNDAEIIEPVKIPQGERRNEPVVIEGEAVEVAQGEGATGDDRSGDDRSTDTAETDSNGTTRQLQSETDPDNAADRTAEQGAPARPDDTSAEDTPHDRPAGAAAHPPQEPLSESSLPGGKGSGRGLTPFIGFVAGGVVAAVFGYGLAEYMTPPPPPDRGAEIATLRQETAARLDALDKRLTALEARSNDTALARLRVALASLRKALDRQSADLGDRIDRAEKRLDTLSEGLTSLRDSVVSRATTAGNAGVEIFDRLQARIDDLGKQLQDEVAAREELAGQIDKVSRAINNRLAAAQQKVTALSQAAQEAARSAELTKMRERLRAAIDTGRAYGELLGAIARDAAISIPAALENGAKTGVPTMAQLRQDFPPAARRALKASIEAQAQGNRWERFQAWLKAQVGARSLAPRQGDDPDAILSRAEAALRAGQLKKAVDLVQTLPPAGVAEMGDWLDAAKRRLAVQTALETFESALKAGQQKETK